MKTMMSAVVILTVSSTVFGQEASVPLPMEPASAPASLPTPIELPTSYGFFRPTPITPYEEPSEAETEPATSTPADPLGGFRPAAAAPVWRVRGHHNVVSSPGSYNVHNEASAYQLMLLAAMAAEANARANYALAEADAARRAAERVRCCPTPAPPVAEPCSSCDTVTLCTSNWRCISWAGGRVGFSADYLGVTYTWVRTEHVRDYQRQRITGRIVHSGSTLYFVDQEGRRYTAHRRNP